jgi:hypothetical protein
MLDLSSSPEGAREKRSFSLSVNTPSATSARIKRRNEGACVSVTVANSSVVMAPCASRSAIPNFAATKSACDARRPMQIVSSVEAGVWATTGSLRSSAAATSPL